MGIFSRKSSVSKGPLKVSWLSFWAKCTKDPPNNILDLDSGKETESQHYHHFVVLCGDLQQSKPLSRLGHKKRARRLFKSQFLSRYPNTLWAKKQQANRKNQRLPSPQNYNFLHFLEMVKWLVCLRNNIFKRPELNSSHIREQQMLSKCFHCLVKWLVCS